MSNGPYDLGPFQELKEIHFPQGPRWIVLQYQVVLNLPVLPDGDFCSPDASETDFRTWRETHSFTNQRYSGLHYLFINSGIANDTIVITGGPNYGEQQSVGSPASPIPAGSSGQGLIGAPWHRTNGVFLKTNSLGGPSISAGGVSFHTGGQTFYTNHDNLTGDNVCYGITYYGTDGEVSAEELTEPRDGYTNSGFWSFPLGTIKATINGRGYTGRGIYVAPLLFFNSYTVSVLLWRDGLTPGA